MAMLHDQVALQKGAAAASKSATARGQQNGVKPTATPAAQKTGFLSGNEMAALAARQINFHVMGYYPITPSTEIAEILSAERPQGSTTSS